MSGIAGSQGLPGQGRIHLLTWFTDLDAVLGFAGDDYELAVVEEAARVALSRWDERVTHHQVAVHVQ